MDAHRESGTRQWHLVEVLVAFLYRLSQFLNGRTRLRRKKALTSTQANVSPDGGGYREMDRLLISLSRQSDQ